jgi:hypothetical protein
MRNMLNEINKILDHINEDVKIYVNERRENERKKYVEETIHEFVQGMEESVAFLSRFIDAVWNPDNFTSGITDAYKYLYKEGYSYSLSRKFREEDVDKLKELTLNKMENWDWSRFFNVIFKDNLRPIRDRLLHVTGVENLKNEVMYITKEEEDMVHHHLKNIIIGLIPLYIDRHHSKIKIDVIEDVLKIAENKHVKIFIPEKLSRHRYKINNIDDLLKKKKIIEKFYHGPEEKDSVECISFLRQIKKWFNENKDKTVFLGKDPLQYFKYVSDFDEIAYLFDEEELKKYREYFLKIKEEKFEEIKNNRGTMNIESYHSKLSVLKREIEIINSWIEI